MYTPDRTHVWNGQGWQPALPVEPAPVAAPRAGIPSWLPPGATPHGLGLSTPAYRLSHTPEPESREVTRRRSSGRLAGTLAGVLAVLIGLGAAAGGFLYYQRVTSGRPAKAAPPTGLAAMVAQPTDVPAGLRPCAAVNFNQRGYLSYLQKKHPERYESALASWSKSQADGLVDAWHVAYTEDPARCDGLLTGQSGDRGARSLLNVLFLTRDGASAARAYAESSNSVPSFVGTQKGAVTGLGEDSTEAYTDLGTFKSYLAVWRSAAYAALLSADGLSLEEARRAAGAVKARMR
jgi:hypothetical protein